jgi:hypothetical protein
VNLPTLSGLSDRMSVNSLRVCQLVAKLLHLLSRLNPRHLGNVVVVETLRVILY